MAGPGSGNETEIKIRLSSPESIVAQLHTGGFEIKHPRVFEANTVYDDPARDLRGNGRLLRLREVAGKAIVTFKGPAERGKHKSREELETTVDDAKTVALIFDRLGFAPTFRYEKYRTEYERPGQRGIVTLDETPLGWFMELEGEPDWIDRTASELGFTETDYLLESYGSIYLQDCAYRGVEPQHMIFGQRP